MYIMPDGRPLRTYLSEVEVAKSQFTARRRRKNGSDDTGWRSGLGREVSEEEQAQIDAGMKAGRARRRRYFNDKLLRDMAGRNSTTLHLVRSSAFLTSPGRARIAACRFGCCPALSRLTFARPLGQDEPVECVLQAH